MNEQNTTVSSETSVTSTADTPKIVNNRRRNLLLALSIAILLLILSIVVIWRLSLNNQANLSETQTETTEADTTPAPVADPYADWLNYINSEMSLSLKHPPTDYEFAGPVSNYCVAASPGDNASITIAELAELGNPTSCLNTYLTRNGTIYSLVTDSGLTLSGRVAPYMSGNPGTVTVEMYQLQIEDTGIWVQMQYAVGEKNKYFAEFEQILKSIELEDDANSPAPPPAVSSRVEYSNACKAYLRLPEELNSSDSAAKYGNLFTDWSWQLQEIETNYLSYFPQASQALFTHSAGSNTDNIVGMVEVNCVPNTNGFDLEAYRTDFRAKLNPMFQMENLEQVEVWGQAVYKYDLRGGASASGSSASTEYLVATDNMLYLVRKINSAIDSTQVIRDETNQIFEDLTFVP
jgi:hypothetical protein